MSNPANDPAQLLVNLFENGQAMMRQSTATNAPDAAGPSDPMTAFMRASQQIVGLQQDYWKQVAGFWSGTPGVPNWGFGPEPTGSGESDKRFANAAWRNDPRFDAMTRNYLAYSSFLRASVDAMPLDEKTKAKLRYDMGQFIDAMSPSNFLVTNPEAVQLAIETGGQSLADGMRLFFDDLAEGRISTTDETAYEVGRNLATTPGAVIYENDLMQVIEYAPATERVHERPLLIIPPCINKFYILDLQPENSFVRYAVEQGHTVFLVSWRNITAELGHLTWDDYLQQGVLQAVDVARAVTGADKINTLGFCVGGTLLASALGVLRAEDRDPVASMTLLTTMLDFSDTGEIGALVSEESVAAREAAIGQGGVMQGKELAFTFSSLRANDLMWQYVVNSYLKGKAPPAFDLLYWNADGTNLPGPMMCWYVRNTYLENNLREPGKTVQCGQPVDLSLIDVPTFLYASREDHIVPWKTAYASTELLSGDTTFVLGASGHIAGVINPAAKNKRNHWVDGAAGPDAERWLATASSVPGSWWPKWSDWLGAQAGRRIAARSALGNRKYRRIEPAPGRYVMTKAG
jgi:poly[(R)-3-hydroxyalkanoate] polymerase subunit PhaC